MPTPNLTSGQMVPGFYGKVDYNTQGGGVLPDRRALLWGYISSAAQRTPNQPFLPASQQEADDGCGRGSDLARYYAACVSQPESQGGEVWLMPIAAPSGGVQSIYKFQILVSTITKAGTIEVWMASQKIAEVGFTTSDTATTIGDAVAAALTANLDLPIASASNSSGVITITYRHKGTTGEDLPIRTNVSPAATGVLTSLGTITFTTAATGAGSVVVYFGALSISTTLSGGETAAQVAAAVIASINADSYPIYAQQGTTTAKVDILLANNKDVRRLSCAVITSTGTTATLTGGSATDGTGSASSFTYNGTVGTSAPSLTAALTNLAGLESFRSWAAPWVDATTVGVLATNIENASDGSITGQKLQNLTICSPLGASTAGAIATSSSPNLTTSDPHYAILRCPDAPVQAMELAARIAGARAALWVDAPHTNWNAFRLRGSERAPILLPPTKPSLTAQNTDIVTYALSPVVRARSGYLEVVKGRTTSLAADKRLWAWSAEAQAAFHVYDLKTRFAERLGGASIVRYSEPKAPGLFDRASVKSIVQEAMRAWEAAGHYDGADKLAGAVQVTTDSGNPFRFSVEYPESPVVDLDQVVFTGHFTSPSA